MNDPLCNNCPRRCNVNRAINKGFCGALNKTKIARTDLHLWEEPPISGKYGSGAVFFCGCNLQCIFCQNHIISQDANIGREVNYIELAEIMLNFFK